MIKRSILLFCVILICFIMPASALTGYRYYVRVDIHNTGASTVTDRVAITMPASTLISDGYMQEDAEDVALTASGVDQSITTTELDSDTATWLMDYVSLGAGGQTSRNIWLGDSGATRDQVWIGMEGDTLTASDDASLDITTDLTISTDVELDDLPDYREYLMVKPWDYGLYVDSENWGVAVWQGGTPGGSTTQSPNEEGDTTELTPNGASDNWDCINDAPPLGSGADTTFVSYPSGDFPTPKTDYYNVAPSGLNENIEVNSVTVYFRVKQLNPNISYYTPLLKLGDNITTGTTIDDGSGSAWVDHNETLSRPGGGTWTINDLYDLQIGISMYGYNSAYCSQLYASISYTTYTETVSDFAATLDTEVNIKGAYDGANLTFYVDDVEKDANALTGSLNTSTNDLVLSAFRAKIDSSIIDDNGTEVLNLEFEPDEISSSTITDLSASGNDVTYSLSSMSADFDVTVHSLSPYLIASYAGGSTYTEPEGLTIDLPDEPDDFTGDDHLYDGLPGSGWANGILDDVEIPRAAFWLVAFFSLMMGVGFMTFEKGRGDITALIVAVVLISVLQVITHMGLGIIDVLMLMIPLAAMYIRRERRTNAL